MSSLNLNKVILVGRLTADPELKQTQSGTAVVSFTVAVNRNYTSRSADSNQPTADFISVVAWRQQAEFVCKYFKKGSSICVIGSIQTRTWTDQNNAKRYITEVVAEEVQFLARPANASDGAANDSARAASFGVPPFGENMQTVDDEDIPF